MIVSFYLLILVIFSDKAKEKERKTKENTLWDKVESKPNIPLQFPEIVKSPIFEPHVESFQMVKSPIETESKSPFESREREKKFFEDIGKTEPERLSYKEPKPFDGEVERGHIDNRHEYQKPRLQVYGQEIKF